MFQALNDTFIAELPVLLDLRIREWTGYADARKSCSCLWLIRLLHRTAYLDPSFEAMVRCQLRFSEEGYERLSGVQRYFGESIRDDYANGQLDAQVENVLAEMKELSIYGM